MNSEYIVDFGLFLAGMAVTIIIIQGGKYRKKHRHYKPKLNLRVYFHNKIKHHLMAFNQITLTDTAPHQGKITVVDDAGNSYTGTLSNPIITITDPAQDTVTVDPGTPDTVIVQETVPTGGTTATLTMDFTAQGNTNIVDGTVFPGLTCQIVLINNVTTQLKLQVAF